MTSSSLSGTGGGVGVCGFCVACALYIARSITALLLVLSFTGDPREFGLCRAQLVL
jgi:hypothetical protein